MIHPETGEVLETREQFQTALFNVNEQIDEAAGALFTLRRVLREANAERFEPVLPERRARTQTQDRVARCPRCGRRIGDEGNEAS